MSRTITAKNDTCMLFSDGTISPRLGRNRGLTRDHVSDWRYGWVITADHIHDDAPSSAGVNGPSRGAIPPNIVRLEGVRFRLLDDDGELCYEGVFAFDSAHTTGFEPLDDFGMPNAGCTRIEYEVVHPVTGESCWARL